jgi:predicted transcriptional regulator
MLAAAKDLRFASQPTRLAAERTRLPVEVWQLVCLCDGTRSLSALQAESGLSRRTLDAALAKLEKLGVVHRVKSQRGTVPAPAHVLEWAARRPAKRSVEVEIDDVTATGMSEIVTQAPLAIEFSTDEEAFFSQTIEHLLEPEERFSGPLDL